MLRFLTAGESHGRALVVIVEGMPAGLLVTAGDIQRGLARRRLGFGRGPRMRFEADEMTLIGGIRHGRTLGSPIAIEIANTEWPKWETEMSPEPRPALQGADPAPPGPRRPGRHAQVRLRRRPRRPRAGLGPGDGGPGGGRHPGQAAAGPDRGRRAQPHRAARARTRPRRAPCPHLEDLVRVDDSPVRCCRPRGRGADGGGGEGRGQGRRLARRGGRGHRLRRPGRPRAATSTGTAGSTPCWPRPS